MNLPQALHSISNGSFSSCQKLASLTLPPAFLSVGDWAFGDCLALAKLFYKQDLDLTAAAVTEGMNHLAYTVEETQNVAGNTNVRLVSSTTTAPTSVLYSSRGEGYIIAGLDSALASNVTLTHDMVAHGCTSAASCLICSAVGAPALGHSWTAAVFVPYMNPAQCSPKGRYSRPSP